MFLHNDKNNFYEIIKLASRYFNVSPAIIEKDYYVTLILYKLEDQMPCLLFKGGTSLSKCYKIIDRFSEDIDITLDIDHQSQSNRKKLKKVIVNICEELGLTLINKDEIKSRLDYNCYKIDYCTENNLSELNPHLLVETVFMVKAFPYENKEVSSLIYDFLLAKNKYSVIENYELKKFNVHVQTLERTFIDKVFAICDYMLCNKDKGHSRHIYDLSRLLPKITIDENFKNLIKEVRIERQQNDRCNSANDGLSVSKLLRKIIDTEYFKRDYIENTEKLLSKQVTYDEEIQTLEEIIKISIFD